MIRDALKNVGKDKGVALGWFLPSGSTATSGGTAL